MTKMSYPLFRERIFNLLITSQNLTKMCNTIVMQLWFISSADESWIMFLL